GVMERAGVDPESIERGEKDPLGELRDRAEAADDGSERNPAASIDATVREEDMGQMSETE
ncbi:MAG: hypothetical protein VX515_00445, partial [Candidatus Thermoplasmatota archaeon]|nr:hypothetical protein [Candidatus Thermoplasmatota archaeon]